MAGLEVLSNIINTVPDQFYTDMVNTWNRECPILSRCMKKQGSSASIYDVLDDATLGASAGLIAEGEDFNLSTEADMDPRLEINLQRTEYRTGFAISTHELRVVRTLNPNITSDGVVARLLKAWQEHQAALGRFLEKKLIYGTGSGFSRASGTPVSDFVGLVTALSPATLTYGSQTKATYVGLQPTVINVGGVMAQSHFSQGFAQMNSVTGGLVPEVIFANPNTCATVIQPIADTNVRQVAALGENAPYKLGPNQFATSQTPIMSVNGIPVYQFSSMAYVVDPTTAQLPPLNLDGYIFACRWQDIVFDYLPERSWNDAVAEGVDSVLAGYAGILDSLGIPVLSYALAKTGASVKFALEGEAGLILRGLNRFIMWYGATS